MTTVATLEHRLLCVSTGALLRLLVKTVWGGGGGGGRGLDWAWRQRRKSGIKMNCGSFPLRFKNLTLNSRLHGCHSGKVMKCRETYED